MKYYLLQKYIYNFPIKKTNFKENKCKKFSDNTQVRTGFLHVLHKVVLHNTFLHMCKTCVLHMTFTHYNPWIFVIVKRTASNAMTSELR